MGIEDLNLDLDEHAERILVIAETASAAERIGKLLAQRAYFCRTVTDLSAASELAADELFDLVVAEVGSGATALEAVHSVVAETRLRRSPVLVIHPKAENVTEEQLRGLPGAVHMLPSPWEPSALLVRVSSELRLRKMRADDFRFTTSVAEKNVSLRDLTNRFKHELQEAQAIQTALLPKRLPSAPSSSFAAAYVPFEAVGGDLYDLWAISDDLFGMFIGDVTGHGLPAAFIAAMTKMALSYASKQTPDEMLSEMNRGLCAHMPDGRFVTAAAAFYTPSDGRLMVARAGHPPGYLWRAAESKVELIAPRGMPLGVLEESMFQLHATRLEPGDKFLFVTDGLTEAVNLSGAVLGVEGTAELFAAVSANGTIDAVLGGLLEKQEQYAEGRIVKDDITLLGVERL